MAVLVAVIAHVAQNIQMVFVQQIVVAIWFVVALQMVMSVQIVVLVVLRRVQMKSAHQDFNYFNKRSCMEIKKVGIGIVLLVMIYYGYQYYTDHQVQPSFYKIHQQKLPEIDNVQIQGTSSAGQACTTDSDCSSNTCSKDVCVGAPIGAPCTSSSDCMSANCTNGYCIGTQNGAACTENYDCDSGYCVSDVCTPCTEINQSCTDDCACCPTTTGTAVSCYNGTCGGEADIIIGSVGGTVIGGAIIVAGAYAAPAEALATAESLDVGARMSNVNDDDWDGRLSSIEPFEDDEFGPDLTLDADGDVSYVNIKDAVSRTSADSSEAKTLENQFKNNVSEFDKTFDADSPLGGEVPKTTTDDDPEKADIHLGHADGAGPV